MDREDVLRHYRETGALLEGHFLLSSGLHSPVYLQSARVLMHPQRAEILCSALARQVQAGLGGDEGKPNTVRWVCAPAMGGIIVGYELARQLGLPSIFAERTNGIFQLRRGFAVQPGDGVLLCEDVVTTGKSSRECIEAVEAAGGEVVAAACLIDRSDGEVDLGVPLFSLCGYKVPTYAADALPPALAAIPAVKPGSRNLV